MGNKKRNHNKQDKDKSGSGFIRADIDAASKQITIDFSGKEKLEVNDNYGNKKTIERDYFNSESVLFFVSNSYWVANRAIYNDLCADLDKYTNSSKKDLLLEKRVLRYVLPYYFSFRHFVETEIKALSIAVKRKGVMNTHYLIELAKDLKDGISKLTINSSGVFIKDENELEIRKASITKELDELLDYINDYKKL